MLPSTGFTQQAMAFKGTMWLATLMSWLLFTARSTGGHLVVKMGKKSLSEMPELYQNQSCSIKLFYTGYKQRKVFAGD